MNNWLRVCSAKNYSYSNTAGDADNTVVGNGVVDDVTGVEIVVDDTVIAGC